MNFAKVYNDTTVPEHVKDVQSAVIQQKLSDTEFAEGLATQNYQQWLDHFVTKNLLYYIDKHMEDSKSRAMILSCDTLIINNVEINKLLIQAETLRKVLQYVRTNKDSF